MALNKINNVHNRVYKFFLWFTSTFLLLIFSASAFAQTEKPNNNTRSKVKITRLQSELSGTNFEPTVEMMKNSPDLVKSEMRLFKQHAGELQQLNNKIKAAKVELKIFERLYQQKSASEAEIREKTNNLNVLKGQMLRMQTQTLVELETEMMRDAQYNANSEMPLKIQVARITAELNDQTFVPTDEMVKSAPDFVKMQQALNQVHTDYSNVIGSRIKMADEELKLAQSAFTKGVISKSEYLLIKTTQNNLVSENLNLQCQILTNGELIKIQTSGPELNELAKQLRMGRIKSQVHNTSFNPTDEMKQMLPSLVELEQNLLKCNQARMQHLDSSEQMLKEKLQLAQKAYNQGVATNEELSVAKTHLANFQDFHKRVLQQYQNELRVVMASLDKNLDNS